MILLHLSVGKDLLVAVEANGCFDLCGADGSFGPGARAAEPELFEKPLVEAGVVTLPPWSATASLECHRLQGYSLLPPFSAHD